MVKFIDDLEISHKSKKILNKIIVILISSFSLYVIYIAFFEPEQIKNDRQIRSELKFEFSGVVYDKFIDSLNHVMPTIILNGGKKIESDYQLYLAVDKNDSISKEKGSLDIQIFKKKKDKNKYEYFKTVNRNALYRND